MVVRNIEDVHTTVLSHLRKVYQAYPPISDESKEILQTMADDLHSWLEETPRPDYVELVFDFIVAVLLSPIRIAIILHRNIVDTVKMLKNKGK